MVISLVSFGLFGPALSTTNINIVKWRYFVIFSPVFFLFLELGIFLFKLGKNILFGIGNTTDYRSSKRAKKNPAWYFEYLWEPCIIQPLILCLPVLSAGNLCKQLGPRSGPTKCLAWSGSKLLDALTVSLKEFFEQFGYEKIKTAEKLLNANSKKGKIFLCQLYRLIYTGPCSAVGYRCESDCRSRGREFDPDPVPYFRGD